MKKKKNFKVDFIGIGAGKCGTTWISKCLAEHPQVCFSIPKETFFFNRDVGVFNDPNLISSSDQCYSKYDREGIKGYTKYFQHYKRGQIRGEWCVGYLGDSLASQKIKMEFPNVKILVCLRNPIDRAYSHFHFFKYTCNFESQSCSFEQALKMHPIPYVYKSCYYQGL